MNERREHKQFCEGHLDCPVCGPESCSRPVVRGPGDVPHTVLCLGCYKTYAVNVRDDDEGTRDHDHQGEAD